MKILELPFRERDVHELLNLDEDRAAPDLSYAGYGWARVDELWLDNEPVRDALVLALHSADDAEPLADDIELELEIPGGEPVSVLLSAFLDKWLPQLPRASTTVLALCNPHRATLRGPFTYAMGNVDSWLDHPPQCIRIAARPGKAGACDHTDAGHRIRLTSEQGWIRRQA